MANTIRNAEKDFDFSKIHLGNPHSLQGGSYFSKILFGPTDETLYIQTPKCKCNKGWLGKTCSNKSYDAESAASRF